MNVKELRKQFNNKSATKAFMSYVDSEINRLDGRCYYCDLVLYVDKEYYYRYPEEWYLPGGHLEGMPRTFIDREWSYHIEHKKPLCRGGSNDTSNITIACPPCNRKKGRLTEQEFKCHKLNN